MNEYVNLYSAQLEKTSRMLCRFVSGFLLITDASAQFVRLCVIIRCEYIPDAERLGEAGWLWLQREAEESYNDARRTDD